MMTHEQKEEVRTHCKAFLTSFSQGDMSVISRRDFGLCYNLGKYLLVEKCNNSAHYKARMGKAGTISYNLVSRHSVDWPQCDESTKRKTPEGIRVASYPIVELDMDQVDQGLLYKGDELGLRRGLASYLITQVDDFVETLLVGDEEEVIAWCQGEDRYS